MHEHLNLYVNVNLFSTCFNSNLNWVIVIFYIFFHNSQSTSNLPVIFCIRNMPMIIKYLYWIIILHLTKEVRVLQTPPANLTLNNDPNPLAAYQIRAHLKVTI